MKKSIILEVVRLIAGAAEAPGTLPNWLDQLCQLIEGRVADTPAGQEAWDQVRARPADMDGHAALADELDRRIASDPDLAGALRDWLRGTKTRRKKYRTTIHQELDAHIAGTLSGTQEITNTTGSGNTTISRAGSVRMKNDKSRRVRIAFLSLGLTLAGGTTAAVLLVPGTAVRPSADNPHGATTAGPAASTTRSERHALPLGLGPGAQGGVAGGGTDGMGVRTAPAGGSVLPTTGPRATAPNPSAQKVTVAAPVSPELAVATDQRRALPGSSFNVSGTGYTGCPDYGDRTVNVLWDGQSIATGTQIEADGTFAAHVVVPDSANTGAHFVYAQCVDGGYWARTTFIVPPPPVVVTKPGSGSNGISVAVRGTGYDGCPNYGDRIVDVSWDGHTTGVQAPIEADGTFSASITVPPDAGAGAHFVYGQCRDGGQWARTTFTVMPPG